MTKTIEQHSIKTFQNNLFLIKNYSIRKEVNISKLHAAKPFTRPLPSLFPEVIFIDISENQERLAHPPRCLRHFDWLMGQQLHHVGSPG